MSSSRTCGDLTCRSVLSPLAQCVDYYLADMAHLVRAHGIVYADAGYQGVTKRPDITVDAHLSQGEYQIAARTSRLAAMAATDREAESRRASVRAKVEHVSLIVKRDFGFTKTRYRGLAKNLSHLYLLFG